jgi:hypothetical protein
LYETDGSQSQRSTPTFQRLRVVFRANKAFAGLDALGQAALEADLIALLRRLNRGGANGVVVPGEYLETVMTK